MTSVDNNVLNKLWEIEMEILDVFHSFCLENHIHYSLGYGTLLGAIRHKGFIPWDDDIDVIMARPEYDRFIELWKHKPIDGFILQNEYEDKTDSSDNFSKLRKNHTTFLESEKDKNNNIHKGIFIDIFPADRVAPTFFQKRVQHFAFLLYMLYYRNYPERSNGLVAVGQKILLSFPKKLKVMIKKKSFEYMTKWNNNKGNRLVVPCTLAYCKKYYSPVLLDEIVLTDFNGKQYYRTKDYDGFLKTMYGDYMQLPPIEERKWKHHPVLIDFEHNYEERTIRNI